MSDVARLMQSDEWRNAFRMKFEPRNVNYASRDKSVHASGGNNQSVSQKTDLDSLDSLGSWDIQSARPDKNEPQRDAANDTPPPVDDSGSPIQLKPDGTPFSTGTSGCISAEEGTMFDVYNRGEWRRRRPGQTSLPRIPKLDGIDVVASQEVDAVIRRIKRMVQPKGKGGYGKRRHDIDLVHPTAKHNEGTNAGTNTGTSGGICPAPSIDIWCDGIDLYSKPCASRPEPDPANEKKTWGTRGVVRLLVDAAEHRLVPFLDGLPWVTVVPMNPGDYIFTVNNRPVWVIERKRKDDLSNGLGKRFDDQRNRLEEIGIPQHRVIYLQEDLPVSRSTPAQLKQVWNRLCIIDNELQSGRGGESLLKQRRDLASEMNRLLHPAASGEPGARNHKHPSKRFSRVKSDWILASTAISTTNKFGFRWVTTKSTMDTVFFLQRMMLSLVKHGSSWFDENARASKRLRSRSSSHSVTGVPAVSGVPSVPSVPSVPGVDPRPSSIESPGRKKARMGKLGLTQIDSNGVSSMTTGPSAVIPTRMLPHVHAVPQSLRCPNGTGVRDDAITTYMLMSIPRLSARHAVAITSKYKTLWILVSAYRARARKDRDRMLADILVPSATSNKPSRPLGKTLSARVYRMLYKGESDPAWDKQRGSGNGSARGCGGKPSFNITGANILTQMTRCIRGVGPEMAGAVNGRFGSVNDLVMYFHGCDQKTQDQGVVENLLFSPGAERAMHKHQGKKRRIGKAVATRIESVVRYGVMDADARLTKHTPD